MPTESFLIHPLTSVSLSVSLSLFLSASLCLSLSASLISLLYFPMRFCGTLSLSPVKQSFLHLTRFLVKSIVPQTGSNNRGHIINSDQPPYLAPQTYSSREKTPGWSVAVPTQIFFPPPS